MKCKKCGNEFFEKYSKYSSGVFCSRSCANSFSRQSDVVSKKIVNCINCGKTIEVDKRANPKKCKCKKCKLKKCNVCGQYICKRKDICKKFQTFSTLKKYFGFDDSKLGTIFIYEEFDRIKNIIEEEYYDNQLSGYDIACKYIGTEFDKKNSSNFNKFLKSMGINLRNLSDAISNGILNNKINVGSSKRYITGWHTTWDNKNIFYRSSYELDYCKELDDQKIKYEVEKLRIVYWDSQLKKQRIAIPDFYLPDKNEIIEIKSTWTYDEQNMKDKFKAYKEHGYNYKLILNHKVSNLIMQC